MVQGTKNQTEPEIEATLVEKKGKLKNKTYSLLKNSPSSEQKEAESLHIPGKNSRPEPGDKCLDDCWEGDNEVKENRRGTRRSREGIKDLEQNEVVTVEKGRNSETNCSVVVWKTTPRAKEEKKINC